MNKNNLKFGLRTDKIEVHNVELPKWAKGKPSNLIKILRNALESEYVNNNIHKWIDLIWGYKQTGKHAERAFNLFYYLTYEGAVNIDEIKDQNELDAITMQIHEFGQTPSQLFNKPHPKKGDIIMNDMDNDNETKTNVDSYIDLRLLGNNDITQNTQEMKINTDGLDNNIDNTSENSLSPKRMEEIKPIKSSNRQSLIAKLKKKSSNKKKKLVSITDCWFDVYFYAIQYVSCLCYIIYFMVYK